MNIAIGPLDETTRQVAVRFEDAGITHDRRINACYDADGQYDEQATAARVQEVARGVAVKIALGVIVPMDEAGETDVSAVGPSAPVG